MIYLIQDCYKNDKGEYIDILKIGYSEKPFMKSRNNQYKTHNYGYKLIGEREGDTELESYIHRKFNSFLLPDSREWFYYNQEIVDNFYTITITDEIEELDKTVLVDWLKEDLIKTIPNPNNLYEKYSKELEEDLSRLTEDGNEIIKVLRIFKKELNKNCRDIKQDLFSINLFEDPFIKSLPDHLNISLDLPQIIGRQRLKENVFRNEVLILYKAESKKMAIINESKLVNDEKVNEKYRKTDNLLKAYNSMSDSQKEDFVSLAKERPVFYQSDYIGISKRTGEAVFNYLVKVADQRAYDVSRREYQDDVTIKRGIESIQGIKVDYNDNGNIESINDLRDVYNKFLDEFNSSGDFVSKMKLLCDINLQYPELYVQYDKLLSINIPIEYQNYINLLGFEKIRALGYRKNNLDEFLQNQKNLNDEKLLKSLSSLFQVGSKYSKVQIKEMLREFYTTNNISKTPKATDLEEYYNLKPIKLKIDDKWEHGFEILSLK